MHKHMNRRAKSTFAASNSSSNNNNNQSSNNNNSNLKWKGCQQSGRQAGNQAKRSLDC